MKILNSKIVEATENELFGFYLTREFDGIMSFPDYMRRCAENGTVIKEENQCQWEKLKVVTGEGIMGKVHPAKEAARKHSETIKTSRNKERGEKK